MYRFLSPTHNDEMDKIKKNGEWCGRCQAGDCSHLHADGVVYEIAGQDLINRPSLPDIELEEVEEEKVDPFAGYTHESGRERHPRSIRRQRNARCAHLDR